MKLIIDIDDKRIKSIKLLAKEQDIATPYPTLEQIIANGTPLEKIRAEIKESIDDFRIADWETNNILADGLQMALNIIDGYREGEQE